MISYIEGNLFALYNKQSDAIKIIPHCVNDLGIWGSGFVIPLGRMFPKAKEEYQDSIDAMNLAPNDDSLLGNTIFSKCPPNTLIAHMIAQKGVGTEKPIRYASLIKCMEEVRVAIEKIKKQNDKPIEIHSPKFCSLRAGGKWELVEELINEIWRDFDVTVYCYEE